MGSGRKATLVRVSCTRVGYLRANLVRRSLLDGSNFSAFFRARFGGAEVLPVAARARLGGMT